MSDQDDIIEAPQNAAEESGPDNFFIDILTGNKESASAKKLLVQKVLRQLIESYGFDRDASRLQTNTSWSNTNWRTPGKLAARTSRS